MKTNLNQDLTITERLLNSGLRETRPAFEARWVAMKRDWRRAPAKADPFTSAGFLVLLRQLGIPSGALAIWAILLAFGPGSNQGQPPPLAAGHVAPKEIREMMEWNGALSEGLALAEADPLKTLTLLIHVEELSL